MDGADSVACFSGGCSKGSDEGNLTILDDGDGDAGGALSLKVAAILSLSLRSHSEGSCAVRSLAATRARTSGRTLIRTWYIR
jgi:hypothetical protein